MGEEEPMDEMMDEEPGETYEEPSEEIGETNEEPSGDASDEELDQISRIRKRRSPSSRASFLFLFFF
jgi:hypothetical protein